MSVRNALVTGRLNQASLRCSLLMWWSVNTVLTTIPIGTLAQAFFFLSFP